ncbi:hypothetical protein Pcinc_007358 [Petrolisthes cinctipes]|uniref:CCHC-type domain-containing protein n=1 Tax=Petrolisthes cinctipes TaxID=88211 RepID=A0AAE1GFG8_PETCI|nr:hypothetical protein Pcinc_007358 [Petrolisthes cinctipes]
MQLFLKDRKPKDIEEMSEVADRYVESRGGWGLRGVAYKVAVKPNSADVMKQSTGKSEEVLTKPTKGKRKFHGNCFLCGKPGHSAKFCYTNRGKVEKVAGLQVHDHKVDPVKTREVTGNRVTDKPTQGYGFKDKYSSQTKDNVAACMGVDRSPDVVRNMTDGSNVESRGGTLPVLSIVCGSEARKMPIMSGTISGKEVEVLRDTGCSTAVVRLERDNVAASMWGVLDLACAAVIDDGTGEKNEEDEMGGHQDWGEMRKSAELLQVPTLHGN